MDFRELASFFLDDAKRCREHLSSQVAPAVLDRVGHHTLDILVRALYARLYDVTHQVLLAHFKLLGTDVDFAGYCDLLTKREVRDYLHRRYTALRPCMEAACDGWLLQSRLLLERFHADEADLAMRLFGGKALGEIAAIDLAAGDVHRGGASVAILRFNDGRKLVYKPRGLAIDVAFQGLLDLIARSNDAPVGFRAAACIDRGDYGWSEFIEARRCHDPRAVERYYRNLGQAQCVLYLLNATDFHRENLLAQGDTPVLIDLETFFRPVCQAGNSEINELYDASVLRVGILPTQFLAGGDALPEVAGMLDATGERGVLRAVWKVEDGQVRNVRERALLEAAANVPGGMPDEAHILALREGFEAMYQSMLSMRIGAALEGFAKTEIRVLFRHTAAYAQLLATSYHPVPMRSQEARLAHFQRLRSVITEFQAASQFVEHEIEDLLRGDIPQFTTHPDSLHLWSSRERRIDNFLAISGLAAAHGKVDRMSLMDMRQQSWMIAAACNLHTRRKDPPVLPVHTDGGIDGTDVPELGQRLVDAAVGIAAQLRAQIQLDQGRAYWLVAKTRNLDGERMEMVQAFCDLHGGMPGEILFFQQLAAMTGDGSWRELMHAALEQLMDGLRNRDRAAAIRSLGLYTGWGGVFFLLARLAQEECCPLYLEWALELLAQHDFEALASADHGLSLVAGSAGFMLAMLDLHAASGSATALAFAQVAAERLLTTRAMDVPGHGWRIASRLPLSGMAHGASGIGMAFARLFAVTSEERYRSACLGTVEFERTLLLPAMGNWRDCRDVALDSHGDTPVAACGWAHGAPGIGLARSTMLACGVDSTTIRDDLDIALGTTKDIDLSTAGHSLLGGSCGSAELFLAHMQLMKDTNSSEHVRRTARLLLAQFTAGDIRLARNGSRPMGLLPGMTGVAYQCLRMAHPGRVPSVLGALAPMPIDACQPTAAALAGAAA